MSADFKVLAFFDRKKVAAETDRRTRKALSRLGARVRQTATRSMRRRKGKSPVGSPPSAHDNPLLKKLTFFTWDSATRSVVVGPIPFGRGTAPAAQEYGGQAGVRLPDGRIVRGTFKPRPFMAPALKAELPHLGECFAAAGA